MNKIQNMLIKKGLECHYDFSLDDSNGRITLLNGNDNNIVIRKDYPNDKFVVIYMPKRLNNSKDTTYYYAKQMNFEEVSDFIDDYISMKSVEYDIYQTFIKDSIEKYKMIHFFTIESIL